MVGLTKFLCIDGKIPNILTKIPKKTKAPAFFGKKAGLGLFGWSEHYQLSMTPSAQSTENQVYISIFFQASIVPP